MSKYLSESLSLFILGACKQNMLCICEVFPEPSLLDNLISTKISSDCSYHISTKAK